jgi:hypothetical protein
VSLTQELADARLLLRRLDCRDLGALSTALLPGALSGEAGRWSLILLALIGQELARREHGGD